MIEKLFKENTLEVLKRANQIALKYNQSHLTLYHLLYATIEDMEIEKVLKSEFDIDTEILMELLKTEIKSLKTEEEPIKNVSASGLVQDFFTYIVKMNEENIARNPTLKKEIIINIESFFASLLYYIKDLNQSNIDSQIYNLFLDSLKTNEDYEKIIHNFFHISTAQLLGISKTELQPTSEKKNKTYKAEVNKEFLEMMNGNNQEEEQIIGKYIFDMQELYEKGKINKNIIFREEETLEVIRILSRKEKSNPLLVGDSGVGKTAIVENLIGKICRGEVPEKMRLAKIYKLDVVAVTAGARYRGDMEQRMINIIDFIKADKNRILFIDNLELAIKDGTTNNDFPNIFKNELSKQEFSCICTADYTGINKILVKDKSLLNKLQQIHISQPSRDKTLEIVKKTIDKYEGHHGVKFPNEVLEKIIYLADRYLHNLNFPDKAFDIIDEIGSLYSSGIKKTKKNVTIVKIEDALEVISKKSKINILTKEDELHKIFNLENELNQKIYGQDKAISELCSALHIAENDLGSPERPYATFLFAGPTGVGKTELLKELSKSISRPLLRFDMSEYSEKHTVSNLIGAAKGYIGYGEGGALVNAVDKEPFSIVLLDEIEKADKAIYNILLQIFDNGFIHDSTGRKISFRDTIIVLTTNAGVFERNKKSIGFKEINSENENENLKNYFSPEFLNRLSAVINFNSLDNEKIEEVARKNIKIIQERLISKNITLDVSKEVEKWLSIEGFNPEMGARPMERTVLKYIAEPISRMMIKNQIDKEKKVIKKVKIELLDNKLDYIFE